MEKDKENKKEINSIEEIENKFEEEFKKYFKLLVKYGLE